MAVSPPAKPAHYLDIYTDLFDAFEIHSVLELGIHKGGSLRFFHDLAPEARIIGIDKDISGVEKLPAGIEIYQGDATDEGLLSRFTVDLVIDDASHIWEEQQRSFEILWPRTKLYVIEDLELCYLPDSGWAKGRNTMEWLKDMIDSVVRDGIPASIAIHPGLVVIEK